VRVRYLCGPKLDALVAQSQPEWPAARIANQRHGLARIQILPPAPVSPLAALGIEQPQHAMRRGDVNGPIVDISHDIGHDLAIALVALA